MNIKEKICIMYFFTTNL